MNIKDIKNLVSFLNNTRFTEMEIEEDGVRIRLFQDVTPVAAPVAAPAPVTVVQTDAGSSPASATDVRIPAEPEPGKLILSPIVGTYYGAPAPDKPSYVTVGGKVKKGQVVCILEAMKLMNEIESEFDGTVAAILVEEGEPVEFGQPLMRIES